MKIRVVLISFLMAVSLGISASGQSCETCYARLEADTLRIGNSLIERSFVWNGGQLRTIALTDKQSGQVFRTEHQPADFPMPSSALAGKGGELSVEKVSASAVRPSFLRAVVSYGMLPEKHAREDVPDTVWVKREFRIFPSVPAISCRNYLHGMVPVESRSQVLDRLFLPGKHWQVRNVSLRDATDYHDNLVSVQDLIPYKRSELSGNLVFVREGQTGNGYFVLKESPCTERESGPEFVMESGHLTVKGWGTDPQSLQSEDAWTEIYGTVVGVYGDSELSALQAFRSYQKVIRTHSDSRDEMIMMNTWGDRSRDARLGEAFCLDELEKAARIGITHFQIDDGWQTGKSPASALARGSFDHIWEMPGYWLPDTSKFPRGLSPIVKRARELGIEPGLWFNPSNTGDLADWEKDANTIIELFRRYDIRYFKVDGLMIKTKLAEDRLRQMFERIQKETDGKVVINLDVTAGMRPGFFFMGEYGNIFVENRYTDFGTYYPYKTLRNLWQLSRYVPPERLQVEFLNKWRNPDRYPAGDRFAPSQYDFSYLFALTMAAQPLAWLEASRLPEEAFQIAPLVEGYKSIMGDFHRGTILPIGEEPSGTSWTGFQSLVDDTSGFLLVFREDSPEHCYRMRTWLPAGRRVQLIPLLGDGRFSRVRVAAGGVIPVELSASNSFALYRYQIR